MHHIAPQGISRRLAQTALATIMAGTLTAQAASLQFESTSRPAITVAPDAQSGLEGVYVLRNSTGVKAVYTAASPSATVTWKKFSTLGGGYAEDVASTHQGATSSVTLTDSDMGYIVDEDGRQHAFWIVNYANHMCSLNALEIAPEQDCTTATLHLDGNAEAIFYYSVNGARRELGRGLILTYNTQEYVDATDETDGTFQTIETSLEIASTAGDIHCPAPLCDTHFTLSGDRFQKQWGESHNISSATMLTHAIDARATARQQQRDADNEQNTATDSGTLGGSAPVEIDFNAATSDAVIFREWQFARDAEFDLIDLRVNEDKVSQTFNDYGTTYVRFVAGNASGTCDYVSDTFTVNVAESRLECPNAFSPNDDGVNDQWKVSYKSIVSFDCHIFNRWGQEVAHLTDPSQGWDGKYNGKTVPPGAYYYVITARGADGHRYKLSGDINIVGFKRNQGIAPGE